MQKRPGSGDRTQNCISLYYRQILFLRRGNVALAYAIERGLEIALTTGSQGIVLDENQDLLANYQVPANDIELLRNKWCLAKPY
jgi:hypothetical protein